MVTHFNFIPISEDKHGKCNWQFNLIFNIRSIEQFDFFKETLALLLTCCTQLSRILKPCLKRYHSANLKIPCGQVSKPQGKESNAASMTKFLGGQHLWEFSSGLKAKNQTSQHSQRISIWFEINSWVE